MIELLKKAIDAHGGLDRWSQVDRVSATFKAAGVGFVQRGPVAEAFTKQAMKATIYTREQRSTFEPFIASDQRGVYEPSRTLIEKSGGRPIAVLDHPRDSLVNMIPGTPWSAPQVLYFIGYSLWMYFTLPYSFLLDDVKCEEVEPWIENGESWRALKVTYPPTFPSHSPEQIHYFDEKGLMRRQDYTVDVRQNLSTAHYIDDHVKVDGLWFATKRRIYVRGQDGVPLFDKLLIAADFSDVTVHKSSEE